MHFIGVDVGTASVRAALVTREGDVLQTSTKNLQIWNPVANHYEQSSTNIWDACCEVIQAVCANVPPESVKSIGFDATCSLVVLDQACDPISVSTTSEPEQNIIMWMDHRAQAETDIINATTHSALQFVGGSVSLEMQTPKLLWLKKHKPETWQKAGHFFDLPDFLTWKATGSLSRSLCSLVCKWLYVVAEDDSVPKGWQPDLLRAVGLGDLTENDFQKLGREVLEPGTRCGKGLSPTAAEALHLLPGTPVATSIIDAHAGGLGSLACRVDIPGIALTERLALICGTSTCHMAVNTNPTFVAGVWGPYYGAMVPGLWLNEGGQSATGKLLDHLLESHPAYSPLKSTLAPNQTVQDNLHEALKSMEKPGESLSRLTQDLHIWPDFHGNRSPLADPSLKGMICGLTLGQSKEDLALLYLAGVQALSYGTRLIVEELEKAGYTFKLLPICGGLSKSRLFVETQADCLQMPVLLPDEPESVLLGAAMLGASASGLFASLDDAMFQMGGKGTLINPQTDEKRYHDKKYQVFLKMVQDQKTYRAIMDA